MGKQNNRTCIICGKQYHYCPNCGEDSSKPTWYFIFHNQNCKNIYNVCTDWRDEKITIEQAYKELSKLDLSDLNNFANDTKNQINEILKFGKKEIKITTDKFNTNRVKK